ncbi:MAG: 6-bladed beta-propeller [Balneola sp.]
MNNQEQGILIPASIDSLENLQVYSLLDNTSLDTVVLERELTINSDEMIYFEGFINLFDVDHQNNIFLVIQNPSQVGIKVFDSVGNYKTKIGRLGRGPGEFESIGSIDIINNKLYVLDTRLQKVVVYSTTDYSILSEQRIKKNETLDDEITKIMRAREIFVANNDKKLIKFESNIGSNDFRRLHYNNLNDNGAITGRKVLDLKNYIQYIPDKELSLPINAPFSRNTLVAFSKTGMIFTSWNEQFLIKAYDHQGNYQYSFYYPYINSSLSVKSLGYDREELNVLEEYQLPDTWPALHTIEVSDDEKLWISTITDSDSTYKWWVLNEQGKLQATFSLPGIRNRRNVFKKPLIKINNGYLYEHDFDFEKGIDRIVKYKIIFKKRNKEN